MSDPIQPLGAGHLATCSQPGCSWEAWAESRDRLATQHAKHTKTHLTKETS